MTDNTQLPAVAKPRRKPPSAGRGRKKGEANKVTRTLKDAILKAAEMVGENGKGKDGLTGYLVTVARTDVKAFASLLGRVLPLQISGDGGGPLVVQIVRFADDQDQP